MARPKSESNYGRTVRKLTVATTLIAVALLAIVIHGRTHNPPEIAISEVSGSSLDGDKVVVSAPEAEIKGHIKGHINETRSTSSQVFACVGGSCNSAGDVKPDGSWSIAKVVLRHPAENESEVPIQAIWAADASLPGAPKYVYSRIISVSFPPPLITLETVCGQQITPDTKNLSECRSLKLEGIARNLLWGSERVCVQIRTQSGQVYETPTPIDDSTADTRHWIVNQRKTGRGHFLSVKIGLDSVPSGAICNTQSVLIERSFSLVRQQDSKETDSAAKPASINASGSQTVCSRRNKSQHNFTPWKMTSLDKSQRRAPMVITLATSCTPLPASGAKISMQVGSDEINKGDRNVYN